MTTLKFHRIAWRHRLLSALAAGSALCAGASLDPSTANAQTSDATGAPPPASTPSAPPASETAAAAPAGDGTLQRTVSTDDERYYDLGPQGAQGNLLELGVFGGVLFLSDNNALNDPTQPLSEFKQPAPEFGVRLGYFPVPFLGVEAELMGAAAETTSDEGAGVYAGRGHLVLQIPTQSVSPFLLVGGGRMGIRSDASGNDHDPALHFGGGLKIFAHRRVAIRVEARDTLTKQRPGADPAHHLEGLLGASLLFGRPDPVPRDSDGDGVPNAEDMCPREVGLVPDGCPERDADSDGFLDGQDQCPQVPGVAPDGCPVNDTDGDGILDPDDQCLPTPGIPPTGCPDGDGDGILDRDDRCSTEPGVAPDGCPPDSDGDGFRDNVDSCPKEPETQNGYEDQDGCPDELPKVVQRFSGVIPGIEFASNAAAIRPGSRGILDEAAGVLNKYPSLKVMIVGHTDSRGGHDHNVELSRKRAEAVKAYLVDRGVDAERIMTRGEGPDEPIADNSTRAGRAKNRRIEFRLVK